MYTVFSHQERASKSVCVIGIDADHGPAKQRAVGCPMVCSFGYRTMATSGDGWGLVFAL